MVRRRPEATYDLTMASGEPIAVVGMACRFPGAGDLLSFWRMLEAGENAVTEGVPGSGVGRIGELFQGAEVRSDACRFAGFIDDIDQFDASFFRISPVEAQLLDPQQRLMLELAWQALEDAGINPDQLRGSRTGVYAGISNNDYLALISTDSATASGAAADSSRAAGATPPVMTVVSRRPSGTLTIVTPRASVTAEANTRRIHGS